MLVVIKNGTQMRDKIGNFMHLMLGIIGKDKRNKKVCLICYMYLKNGAHLRDKTDNIRLLWTERQASFERTKEKNKFISCASCTKK